MSDVDEVFDRLTQANELMFHNGHVTDEEIRQLTDATGCTLPQDYLAFLKRFGYAVWEGHAIYGVYDFGNDKIPASFDYSATLATQDARKLCSKEPYPRMNDSLVLEMDGMGGYFILLSTAAGEDDAVLWVNYEDEWVVTDSWDSFTAFLDHQLAAV